MTETELFLKGSPWILCSILCDEEWFRNVCYSVIAGALDVIIHIMRKKKGKKLFNKKKCEVNDPVFI